MTVAISPKYLVDTAEVRRIAGRSLSPSRKPVTRQTLIVWRQRHGFPKPLKAPKVAGELWDVREVRLWVRERAAEKARKAADPWGLG
jgi:hypothetical protein